LESAANTDAGTYTLNVQVSLLNYPAVTASTTATMTVDECVVTAITPSTSVEGLTVAQNIYDTLQQIPYAYTQVPACGYAMTVSSTSTPASPALVLDQANQRFDVYSIDANDEALGIAVFMDVTLTGDPFTLTESFTLDVANPCKLVTPIDQDYTLHQPEIVFSAGD